MCVRVRAHAFNRYFVCTYHMLGLQQQVTQTSIPALKKLFSHRGTGSKRKET